MKLDIEEISNQEAIDVLMDTFKGMPYVQKVEVRHGGIFGSIEKRDFWAERQFDNIPARIFVQQYYMKNCDAREIRKVIQSLEYQIDELKEQLRGLEYYDSVSDRRTKDN